MRTHTGGKSQNSFFGEWGDGVKAEYDLPTLTDEMLLKFQRQHHVKLPESLLALLRLKNGGVLNNSDFRFSSRHFVIDQIFGIGGTREKFHIDSFENIYSETTYLRALKKRLGGLAKVFSIACAGGYPYQFALDYNCCNRLDEPSVICVHFEEESIKVENLADSFAEFLKAQYAGEKIPFVTFEEADKYELIHSGDYFGQHILTQIPIRIAWKICVHKKHLLVFTRTSWDGAETFRKATILKSKLIFSFAPLSEVNVEIEPELAALIQHAVAPEILSLETAYTNPPCYRLDLHVVPNQKNRVVLQESSPFEDRWKNSTSHVVYDSVFSSDRLALEKAFNRLACICARC